MSSCTTPTLGTTNHKICAPFLDQLIINHTRVSALRSMIILRKLAANMKRKPSDR